VDVGVGERLKAKMAEGGDELTALQMAELGVTGKRRGLLRHDGKKARGWRTADMRVLPWRGAGQWLMSAPRREEAGAAWLHREVGCHRCGGDGVVWAVHKGVWGAVVKGMWSVQVLRAGGWRCPRPEGAMRVGRACCGATAARGEG